MMMSKGNRPVCTKLTARPGSLPARMPASAGPLPCNRFNAAATCVGAIDAPSLVVRSPSIQSGKWLVRNFPGHTLGAVDAPRLVVLMHHRQLVALVQRLADNGIAQQVGFGVARGLHDTGDVLALDAAQVNSDDEVLDLGSAHASSLMV